MNGRTPTSVALTSALKKSMPLNNIYHAVRYSAPNAYIVVIVVVVAGISLRGVTNLSSPTINPPSIDAARNPRIYPNVGDKIYQGLLPYANIVKPANPRGHMLVQFSKPSYQGLE
jgi:hypothetical protein